MRLEVEKEAIKKAIDSSMDGDKKKAKSRVGKVYRQGNQQSERKNQRP